MDIVLPALLLIVLACTVFCGSKRHPLLALSAAAYVLWWIPGLGLVAHGWDQVRRRILSTN